MIIEQEKLTKILAQELAIVIYSQILGYTVITSPLNNYLLEQKELSSIKNSTFDNFMLEQMLEGIKLFK